MALTKISTGGVKDDAASQAKIADEAVDEARLQVSNAGSNGQFLSKQSGNTGGLTWATPPDNNTVYTHPNHSGEVTSTGDGATVIASNIVDEDNLKISNAGTNGQYLQKQSGNTGGLTWADVTVPPAGNTVSLVADGAIAAGKPVIIKSNGKAAQVGESMSARNTINQTSAVNVTSHSNERHCQIVYDPNNDYAVLLVSEAGADLDVQCLSVNGTNYNVTGTTGSRSTIVNDSDEISACWDSTNNKIVVAYKDTNDNGKGKIIIGTFSAADATTWTSSTTFDSDTSENIQITYDPAGEKFLISYRTTAGGSTWRGACRVMTLDSSGNISIGTRHQYNGTSNALWARTANISSNLFAVQYGDGGNSWYPTVKTATISGTNISFGNAAILSENAVSGHGYGGDMDISYDSENQKLIGAFIRQNNSTTVWARVGSLSGTSISWDAAEVRVTTGGEPVEHIRVAYDPGGKKTWMWYVRDEGATNDVLYGGELHYKSSATNKLEYDSHSSWQNTPNDLDQMGDVTFQGTRGKVLIPVNNSSDTSSSYIFSHVVADVSTNLTTHNPIGFAPSAISDGNTGTINCDGNTVTTSGLTTATRYYVANDGTFQTSVGTTYAGGVALSSTKLLIKMST